MAGNNDAIRHQIRNLRDDILMLRRKIQPSLKHWTTSSKNKQFPPIAPLKLKKILGNKPGEIGDGTVSGFQFGAGPQLMSLIGGANSASSAIVWDMNTGKKANLVGFGSPWLFTGTIEETSGRLVAAGGLENAIFINEVDGTTNLKPNKTTLTGHDACVYDTHFVGEDRMLSAAGDKLMKLWDIEKEIEINTFEAHTADLFCCAVCPRNPNMFLSGAGDFTARVWESRTNNIRGDIILTFDVESRDVICCAFHPEGGSFVVGNNDSTLQLHDIRACTKLGSFHDPQVGDKQIDQVAFSPSGRLLFTRCSNGEIDNGYVFVYDTTKMNDEAGHGRGPINTQAIQKLPNGGNFSKMAVHSQGSAMVVIDQPRGDMTIKGFWPRA